MSDQTGAARWRRHLILASKSPRRSLLLKQAGYVFTQIDPPFADPPGPSGADASQVAAAMAGAKAQSALRMPELKDVARPTILSADTIVVSSQGQMLGKPQSPDEARQMLTELRRHTHRVISAAALIDSQSGQCDSIVDQTHVCFGDLSEARLQAHIDSGQWQGKAGGYNLDEVEYDWAVQVVGDRSTVIGLPMTKLEPHLVPFRQTHDA